MIPIQVDGIARTVTLADFPALPWKEPFFQESIAKAWQDFPTTQTTKWSFEHFIERSGKLGGHPKGFICHVGRCGSTLLANMLAAAEHVVLKEPDIISDIMARFLESSEPDLEKLIVAIIRHFRKIIKFSAWNIGCLSNLMNFFPDTPVVFVYRAPHETVASMLFDPPSWHHLAACPRVVQARFFPSIRDIAPDNPVSLLAMFAHAWRSIVEYALTIPPETVLFVNYADLVGNPSATSARILRHLRQPIDESTLACMTGMTKIYSKDIGGHVAFDPGGTHHRPPLSSLQRAIVSDITDESWSKLASYGRQNVENAA